MERIGRRGDVRLLKTGTRRGKGMEENERVVRAIFRAVDEVNEKLPGKERLERSLEAVLFGREGSLDSLGLVNLIVAVEEKIEEEFGTTITIADERAMAQRNNPFRSVETLVSYVRNILNVNRHG